jgi:hypothetical protein
LIAYVELYLTIPSSRAGSIRAGTRAIVRAVDPARTANDFYLVEFLDNERLTGDQAWLRAIDLLPA